MAIIKSMQSTSFPPPQLVAFISRPMIRPRLQGPILRRAGGESKRRRLAADCLGLPIRGGKGFIPLSQRRWRQRCSCSQKLKNEILP